MPASGSFFLPTYGLLVALGFLTGLWTAAQLAGRAGLNKEDVLNLGVYTAIAGLVGAKVSMLVMDFGYYVRNPLEIFSLSTLQAAGIFYGGLIFALVTAAWYMRRRKMPGLATADAFAPGIAIGHGIGRLGCFAAGCCWGAESHLPWAVTFTNPEAHRLVGVPLGIALQPTQLYEAVAEGLIFLFLYWRFQKEHRPGTIIGLYLVFYSTVRFLVEFVRAHDEKNPFIGPFVIEQWVALGLAVLGIWFLTRRAQQARRPAKVLSPTATRKGR
jgi:phosphatidylglycerol:prolipoprotein diacylglycerol transferase